jgi:molecular chaperone GrpE
LALEIALLIPNCLEEQAQRLLHPPFSSTSFEDSTPERFSMTPQDFNASEQAQAPSDQDPQPHSNEQPLSEAEALSSALAEVATLKAKVEELQDQYIRGQAEVMNARKRADEEVSKARKFAIESFAEGLLPVLDSLEAGLQIKEATPEQIKEGAEATLRQLKSALERNKVIAIDPQAGTKFDPHHHQAISVVPAEQDPNTVVSVLQKGYLISERILRPALVTVTAS